MVTTREVSIESESGIVEETRVGSDYLVSRQSLDTLGTACM